MIKSTQSRVMLNIEIDICLHWGKGGGGLGCSFTCGVCPETILPVFYNPVDLPSSELLSCSDILWRCSVALDVLQGGCSCPKANFYSLLTIFGIEKKSTHTDIRSGRECLENELWQVTVNTL